MIKTFVDKRTAALFAGFAVRNLPNQIQHRARAKLVTIDAAKQLEDLRIPPGNRLEALTAIGAANTASASTTNGAYALCGGKALHGM